MAAMLQLSMSSLSLSKSFLGQSLSPTLYPCQANKNEKCVVDAKKFKVNDHEKSSFVIYCGPKAMLPLTWKIYEIPNEVKVRKIVSTMDCRTSECQTLEMAKKN